MKTLANACFILAILNFVAFFVISLFLGGDAINGGMDDGRYYLASHGQYTEVSHAVFEYSRWHVYSLIVTTALGFAGGILSAWLDRDR